MHSLYNANRPRGWRGLFLLAAILAALSGAFAPASAAPYYAHPQNAALSTQHSALLTQNSKLLSPQSSVLSPQHSPQDDPVPAPPALGQGRFRYFPQTAHFLRGAFFSFWETHGATRVLGLPITEALDEDGLAVQYLERARLEWHPENPGPRNQVLLTRLGAVTAEARGLTFEPLPSGDITPTSFFFVETRHNLSNAFLSYWQRNGGLAVFGYPISEELVETNTADGRDYTVQYFERNRFEWHPESPSSANVQLGLLGVEYARMVSLNPLARILLPAALTNADRDLSDSPQLAKLVDSDLLPAVQALGRTPQFRWVPAVLIKNNIPVEFSDIDEEGVAGALITTRSRTRPYVIVVPASERDESLLALASVLAHEATHAYDVTTGVVNARLRCSVEEELRAYMNGLAAWLVLQGEGALSQVYAPRSLDAAVNRSVREFNSNKTRLDLDFNPQDGRDFLRDLYGEDCGT